MRKTLLALVACGEDTNTLTFATSRAPPTRATN